MDVLVNTEENPHWQAVSIKKKMGEKKSLLSLMFEGHNILIFY